MATTTSIPLTTTFTPAPECFTDYYKYTTTGSSQWYMLGPPSTSLCQPPGWDSSSQYFSPGICPSGYTAACSDTTNIGKVTETRAMCCPTSWACQGGGDKALPWLSTIQCTKSANFLSTTQTTPVRFVEGGSTTTFMGTINYGLNAFGVSIRYQSDDFATTSSSMTTPTLSSSASQSSSTPPGTSNGNGSGGSLSTGVKAGIGAGVGILAVLALAFAIFFITRHRKRNGANPDVNTSDEQFESYREMPVEIAKSGVGTPASELSGQHQLSEMQGTPVDFHSDRRN